ncbi:MAG: hypothetical protein HC933_11015, partial [Pleurocapsa sp. SU_196_0]|nr:hypothetical protein [Pleurocapsa sp. SU_196_0]
RIVEYLETGEVPAWYSSLGIRDGSLVCSVAASLACAERLPALACGVSSLRTALELWI